MDNDIEKYLEYEVSDPEWLELINDPKRLFSEIICWNSLFQYMVEKHEKYCTENCLCEVCRSELKEYMEYIDGEIADMYWSCSNGC